MPRSVSHPCRISELTSSHNGLESGDTTNGTALPSSARPHSSHDPGLKPPSFAKRLSGIFHHRWTPSSAASTSPTSGLHHIDAMDSNGLSSVKVTPRDSPTSANGVVIVTSTPSSPGADGQQHTGVGPKSPRSVFQRSASQPGKDPHSKASSPPHHTKVSRDYEELLRHIPPGTESAQVFVGVITEFQRIHFVMVRLAGAEPPLLPDLLPAPIPVRFLFFILGPPSPGDPKACRNESVRSRQRLEDTMIDIDYHEVGRALSTVLSNETFASAAKDPNTSKGKLLGCLDEYLDYSVVIPQQHHGRLDSRHIFSVQELQKALNKRRRKKDEFKRKVAEYQGATVPSIDTRAPIVKFASPTVSSLSAKSLIDKDVLTTRRHSSASGGGSSPSSPSKASDVSSSERWPPLQRRGKPFYGLIEDVKQRLPLYKSDITDGWDHRCVTSLFFIFFAAFAPAIAFGGLLAEKTHSLLGVTETLLAQCVCGLIWAAFSAQPLLIMAATGPVLVFEGALYAFSDTMGIEFLVFRVWISFWVLVIGLIVVACEGSMLIRYVTRFTEDIFALLISLIFVYESLKFVFKMFLYDHPLRTLDGYCNLPKESVEATTSFLSSVLRQNHSSNYTASSDNLSEALTGGNNGFIETPTNKPHCSAVQDASVVKYQPDTALLTAILLFGTFYCAYTFKRIRTSHLFGRTMRKAIGDFGVPLAVTISGIADFVIFREPYIKRLEMPTNFGLTCTGRAWFIPPMGMSLSLEGWVIPAAMVPAFLLFIILFVETEITQLLLAKPERGLRKGTGFHWDMLLVCICTVVCSLFGLPWMCAAAVQSLAHVSSVTVPKKSPIPGEPTVIDYVIEQRVTTVGVSILIGACAFLGVVLRFLPLAVLYGIFLYLGIASMAGIQFLKRVALIFIPQKYFPQERWAQAVHLGRMHTFTALQGVCFGVIWGVKSWERSALAFPFVMMLIALFRKVVLPRIFTPIELSALDGEESDGSEGSDNENEYEEVYDEDFYEQAHGFGL